MSKKICCTLLVIFCLTTLVGCTDANITIRSDDPVNIKVRATEDEVSEIIEKFTDSEEDIADSEDDVADSEDDVADSEEDVADSEPDYSKLKVYELPEDDFNFMLNPYRDYLILVNEDHPYEFGGIYDTLLQPDLANVADVVEGAPTPVEEGALYAFTELQHALHQQGVEIGLYSAYRTEQDQEWVVEHYGPEAKSDSLYTVAEPGYTEHHTGLLLQAAIWLSDDEGGYRWTILDQSSARKYSATEIMREALADYGFIERFPRGKKDITGVNYEPCELRFVGSSKVAHEIMDNDLTLEEYLEEYSEESAEEQTEADK